jgi:hypothetical protein
MDGMMPERDAAADKVTELQDEIAKIEGAIKSLWQEAEAARTAITGQEGAEAGPPPRVQSGASPRSASTADEPRKVEAGRAAPEALFTSDTPAAAAAPQAAPTSHRNGNAIVMLIAGLVILGTTGFVVTQGTVLSSLTAGVSGNRPSRMGDGPEAAAPAAKPMSLPVAYERQTQTWGTSIAPLPKHKAPQRAPLAPTMPPRAAPARMAPPAPLRDDRPLVDPSLGKSLRQAGDAKILEGDIASARLFYERAADAGDARAALYLGNSFNPAFLARLGVLGMRGDVVMAARWYRRALSLGSPDAEKALRTLPR